MNKRVKTKHGRRILFLLDKNLWESCSLKYGPRPSTLPLVTVLQEENVFPLLFSLHDVNPPAIQAWGACSLSPRPGWSQSLFDLHMDPPLCFSLPHFLLCFPQSCDWMVPSHNSLALLHCPFPFSKCGSHLANPDPCYVHLVRWCCKSAILNMPEKMENSAVATRLGKVSFHSNPKERQCQRVLKLPHSWLISHASKVMLKILQGRLQQDVNQELPDIPAGFRKGRGTRDQIANICWIVEKTREIPEVNSIYFCFIDYAKAFDCVNHNKLWKILKEMGMPGYLTCLLRNLKVGQEATVRTRYEITDWFQIRKGVHQGCTLSPCFFTLYTE